MTGVGRAIEAFLRRLDEIGIAYLIGGSFASSVWGDPRQTNDLDVAVRITPEQGDRLAADLSDEFMIHAPEIRATLNDPEPFRAFQALHYEESFKIDVFVPHDTPFVRSEFERAITTELLPGLFVRCSTAEDIVLRKLMWFELGNRVSDRQWNDIVRVIDVRQKSLDYAYLGRWAGELGVDELLDEALAQTIRDDPFA